MKKLILFLLLCLFPISSWAGDADHGDGIVIPMANILVIASDSGVVTQLTTAGIQYTLTGIGDVYDRNDEWDGVGTFTSSINQTILIHLKIRSTSGGDPASVAFGILSNTRGFVTWSYVDLLTAWTSYCPGVFDRTFVISVSQGEKISIYGAITGSGGGSAAPVNNYGLFMEIYRIK